MEEKYQKIIEAAKAGGQVLKHYFGQVLAIEEKSMPADIRTKADLESEEAILKILKKEFPDYNIHSEETDNIENGSEFTFIIDPLDGSNNFNINMPFFSVLISLVNKEEVIFSVTHDPILNRTYRAIKGQGSFLNNKRIKVNQEDDFKKASISYTASYTHDIDWHTNFIDKMNKAGVKRVMEHWSVGLDFALLASGKIEAIVNDGCEVHDYIGGKLLAQEAGAIISDFNGKAEKDFRNDRFIAVNNQVILNKILKILK